MKKTILIFFALAVSLVALSQTTIKMDRVAGIFLIPCKVNGLDLNMIFDTGASDVSISLPEASAMIKSGMLTKQDFIGNSNYFTATGDITNGMVINIKEIEIADLKLHNVRATILSGQGVPLLLGQSAISKLGKIQLDPSTNTLTILDGKGTYDYSSRTLANYKNYYSEFSINKIERTDNKDGLEFSFILPKKWKEQKVSNLEVFKNYYSDEFPDGMAYELRIGTQTLPSLYNSYDSCRWYVNNLNNLYKNTIPELQLLGTFDTKISVSKAIKNVILFHNSDGVYCLNLQYYIFIGNKVLTFIYYAYSSELKQLISNAESFESFCDDQSSKIVVYNAFYKANTCTIETYASQNQKEVSVILNDACEWFKTDGKNELNLINKTTNAFLSVAIGDENAALNSFARLNSKDLNLIKKEWSSSLGKDNQKVLFMDTVTIAHKTYLYFLAESTHENNYVFTDCYWYIINNRQIMIMSILIDKNKENLNFKQDETSNSLRKLLNGIEIIGQEPDVNSLFETGLLKAQNNDFKGAIKYFTQVIKQKPLYAEAFYNRGIVKYRLHDNKGALEDFSTSIKLKPDVAGFYYNRGTVKVQTQDFQGALADFGKAQVLKPDFADAYLNSGIVRIILGSKVKGCQDLNMAKKLGSVKAEAAIKLNCL